MNKPPISTNIIVNGQISREWVAWFQRLWAVVDSYTGSGTTAERPKTGLYKGRYWYDTTLDIPIWLKSVNPDIWIDANGAPV